MAVQPEPVQADRTLTLALNRIGELFYAPDVNPFSSKPVDLRGESGVLEPANGFMCASGSGVCRGAVESRRLESGYVGRVCGPAWKSCPTATGP